MAFGVESGSDKILKYMRKGYQARQIDKAFKICRDNKIITTCNFMIGTPGETKGTMQESIDMLKRIKPNLLRWSITTPTPGSDLYRELKEKDLINLKHLSEFDRWAAYPIKLEFFSKEDIQKSMKDLLDVFYWDFFRLVLNPIRIAKEFYFIKILMLRYLFMFTKPVRLLKDIVFYLNYFKYRKGRDTKEDND
ncbi:MAG: radical SAM protein [Candidatus Omnitrophota bacterium]